MLMDGKIQYGKAESFSQLNYRFNAVPTKNPETIFFKGINTLKNVYGKAKNWELANTTLKERIKLENSHCQISSLTIKL